MSAAKATESHEYCVVMPLRPMVVGRWIDRSRWPHHVTVCPPFRSGPQDIDVLAAVLARVAATLSLPVATVGDSAHFGPYGATPVQLVESPDLHSIHLILMDMLAKMARVDPLEPRYNGAGYRPHVTVVDGRMVELASALSLNSLLLVEIAPDQHRSMAVPVSIAHIGEPVKDEPVTAERAARTWSMLQDKGIRSWVIGGWGIDALLGSHTRDHHDIDLFVLDEDLGTLLDLLESPGSGVKYLWSESRWHDRLPSAFVADIDGVEVDVHVVGLAGDGVSILSQHSLELPPGALSAWGHITGVQVACATAEAQRLMHTGYDLPEKHLRDLELLRELEMQV